VSIRFDIDDKSGSTGSGTLARIADSDGYDDSPGGTRNTAPRINM